MNIYEKFSAIKTEIGILQKTADNPFAKSKYTPLSVIQITLTTLMAKHKVVMLWQMTKNLFDTTPGSKLWDATATLIDIENPVDRIAFPLNIPQDTTQKNESQAWGSTSTYAKRYGYAFIFDIAFDDDDPEDSRLQTLQKKIEARHAAKKEPVVENLDSSDDSVDAMGTPAVSIAVDLSTGEVTDNGLINAIEQLAEKSKKTAPDPDGKFISEDEVRKVWNTAKDLGFTAPIWNFVMLAMGWTSKTVPTSKRAELKKQFTTKQSFQHWYSQWEEQEEKK
jgi:hypothetical protein